MPIFRQAALDRLASPEQLDQLMRVTSSRGWLALTTLIAMLVGGVVWGVVGRLPEQVVGRGILVRSGGVFEVSPTQGGRVSDVSVSVGDVVQAGQVIARVYQPEQADKLTKAQAARDLQLAEVQRTERANAELVKLQTASLTTQADNLKESIAATEQDAAFLAGKVATQTKLADQGLITRQTVVATREQYEAARERIRGYHAQIASNRADLTRVTSDAEHTNAAARAKLEDAERDLAGVTRDLRATSEVTSPYTGRILEVMVGQGDIIRQGEAIVSLDLSGRAVKGLEAIVYVKSSDGKKLRPGMQILIAPSTVRVEEFGFMVGRVTYVSSFPATARGMTRMLKNDKLVASLAGNDAPYQVHADLIPDASTRSHYRWTSAKGPPILVESGTLCNANILVDEKRPIEMVVPIIRQQTGM